MWVSGMGGGKGCEENNLVDEEKKLVSFSKNI